MAPPVKLPGGDLEYAVLHEVWTRGDATTREVYERVGEPRGVVYTTIAKVLDRLHAKGLVTREREGKMFRYAPRRKREVVERARVGAALAQILNPEVRPAIATLVDAVESLDPSCWTSPRVRSRRAGSHAMDRDLVLTGLVIATVGTTVLLVGAWPQRIEPPVSARTWERISWRGL